MKKRIAFILLALIAAVVFLIGVHAVTVPSSYQQKVSKLLTTSDIQTFYASLSDDQKNVLSFLTKKEIKLCFDNTTSCLTQVKSLSLQQIDKESKFKKRVLTYDLISGEEERIPLIKKRLEDLQDQYEDAKKEFLEAKEDLKDCEKDNNKCPEETEKSLEKAKAYLSIVIDLAVERLNLVLNRVKLSTELSEEDYTKASSDITAAIATLAQFKGQISLALTKKDAKEQVAQLKVALQNVDNTRGLSLGILLHAKLKALVERGLDFEEKVDCTLARAAENEIISVLKEKAETFSQSIEDAKMKLDTAQELISKIQSMKGQSTQPRADAEKREIGGLIVSLNEIVEEVQSGVASSYTLSTEIDASLKNADVELKSCKTEEYVVVKPKAVPVSESPAQKKEAKKEEEAAKASPQPETPPKTEPSKPTVNLEELERQTAQKAIDNLYTKMQNLQVVKRQKLSAGQSVDSTVDTALSSVGYNLAVASGLLNGNDTNGAKEKIDTVKKSLETVEALLGVRVSSSSSSTASPSTTRNTTATNATAARLDTKEGLSNAIKDVQRTANSIQSGLDSLQTSIENLVDDREKYEKKFTPLNDEVLAIRQSLGLTLARVSSMKSDTNDFATRLAAEKNKYLGYKVRLDQLKTNVNTLKNEVDHAD